jgi:hypothetical protein
MSKTSNVTLIVLLAIASIVTVESANAQSIPKPSAPEFTVKWTNNSYIVPVTSSIDPYSGSVVNNPSELKINYSIELRITNQPTSETLRYNVRTKGHFEGNWSSPIYSYEYAPVMSNQSTTIIFTSTSNDGTYRSSGAWTTIYAPVNGQLDLQVQAFVGYYTNNGDASTPLGSSMHFTTVNGEWSNTQTIAIAGPYTPVNTSPNSSPTVPEFPFTAILPLFVVTPLIAIVLIRKREN